MNTDNKPQATMPRLGGIIPVLPIPFDDNEKIIESSFVNMVNWLRKRNVDGAALFGLASEYWKLSSAEKEMLVEVFLRESEGRIPAFVGVTEATRVLAVREAVCYAKAGASAIVIMPPSFMAPKSDMIISHCRAIADAVAPLPVIIQYSPAYVGNSISVADFVDINTKSPNVQYIKVEPRPPGPMIDAINNASDGKLSCFIGQGGLTLADCCNRGIAGIMPGVAIIEVYHKLWNQLNRNEIESPVWDIHDRLVSLVSHIVPTMDMWVAGEKRMLMWRNIIQSDVLRSPSSSPDAGFYELLFHLYQRILPYLDKE